MRRAWLGVAVAAVLTWGILVGAACSNGANGVDACRQLETARCQRAMSCGIDIQSFPVATSGDPVEACELFYDDACLHGLVTSVAFSQQDLDNCTYQIEHDPDCNTVVTPQSNPACAWLNPPDAGPDATDATTVDVTTTVDVVVTVPDSTTVLDAGYDASAYEECIQTCEDDCIDDPGCQSSCEEMQCVGN
jgi:hypothetical protein